MLDSLADPQSLMPTLFIGHGAPLYTLDENPYSLAWRKIAAQIPKPKAIVCISAHWLTKGTQVMAMQNPRTIHDFGRMDDRLFQIQYAAAGNPELAQEIIQKVQKAHIEEDHHWGFDHGTWTVLRWMYPKADIPIIQISLDYKKDLQYHYDLAKELAFLRKQGVLIVGSGNIVHNLRSLKFPENSTYDWAIEFDQISKELIENRNHQALIQYEKLGEAARLSIPTPDHYLPLLYILGLQTEKEKATFPIEGISYGSTSMRSVLIESF
ncbi:4,5-DOPA dioxygenase extradiol [Hugenholtzia roseola]|uniref:4,5-DOPA-extradiol-dioxygenase n=1 Tax=Hugenholtzia roseola TaxID=1002 RepID=UPI0005523FDF|nr:4,5-DOPA dioxygenase extradiol [Hugenholtzia roseola]